MAGPAAGGVARTIFTSRTLGIAVVRAISKGSLLLQVNTFSRNRPVDTRQNGIWTLHTDGSNLKRLTTDIKGNSTSLCQFSQNPWSNVSRDGNMYAFETASFGTYPYNFTLYIGMLSGGTPVSFASITDGTQLAVVGWTTM
jgi:hypothetical protein